VAVSGLRGTVRIAAERWHSQQPRPYFGPSGVPREETTMPDESCVWTQVDHWDDDHWETSCGDAFILMDGSPAEHHMRYCYCCGKPIRVEAARSADVEEE